MLNNQKLAYDLALIYAETKFKVANKNGVAGLISPDNEPETEYKMLSTFFNDAYNWYITQNLSEITEL